MTPGPEKKKAVSFISEQEDISHTSCGLTKSNLSRMYLLLHARTIDIGALGTVGWLAGGSSCRLVLNWFSSSRGPITPCPCELFDCVAIPRATHNQLGRCCDPIRLRLSLRAEGMAGRMKL